MSVETCTSHNAFTFLFLNASTHRTVLAMGFFSLVTNLICQQSMDLDNSYRAAKVLKNFFSQFYEYMYEYIHTHTGNNLEGGE